MQMDKLSASIIALLVAAICACGGTAQPAASSPAPSSPAASPAVTLESIAAQPADLPAMSLQKCDKTPTGKPASGDLSASGYGEPGEWAAVRAAGAVEGWIQWLGTCPIQPNKARVRNDLIRFRDAAAAAAFFQSEKANAKTTGIFWPLGKVTEGAQTGFGPISVTNSYGGRNFGALWLNGSLLISYATGYFENEDGRSGALAVNARVP